MRRVATQHLAPKDQEQIFRIETEVMLPSLWRRDSTRAMRVHHGRWRRMAEWLKRDATVPLMLFIVWLIIVSVIGPVIFRVFRELGRAGG